MARTPANPSNARPRRRTYLAEWRAYRGNLTQAKLAELADLSESSISQIEAGKQWYSPESLDALARALNCTPGDLMAPPSESVEVIQLWNALDPRDRERAMRMLRDWANG